MAADRAIERGYDQQVEPDFRAVLLPALHALRILEDQERSVSLNEALGEDSSKWARHHHEIVARFGRFPHRNAILGRETTPEEEAFLASERATFCEWMAARCEPDIASGPRVDASLYIPSAPRAMAATPVRETSTRPTAVISLMKRSTSSVVPVSS